MEKIYKKIDFYKVCELLAILIVVILPFKSFSGGIVTAYTSGAATICSGNTTVMTLTTTSCTVGGGATITYQWQESNDNGSTDPWANAVGGSGATTTSYTSPALSANIYYRCKIVITGSSACTAGGTNWANGTYYVNSTSVTSATASTSAANSGVLITVTAVPTAVTVSTAGTYCGSTTLTATGGTGGTIYFQNTTSNGTSTATASSSQSISTSGTYYFRALNGTCWGTQGSAAVTINPNPTITLGSNPSICAGATSANLSYSATTNSPDQYAINFDVTAEGQGFVDVAYTTLPATPIVLVVPAGAAAGTYNATLTVKKASTGCVSGNYAITVTINTVPTTAAAGPDQTTSASTATLAANSPSIGTGAWSVVSGSGVATTPSSNTSGVTGLTSGASTTFRWTISNGGCSNYDDVIITRSCAPTYSSGTGSGDYIGRVYIPGTTLDNTTTGAASPYYTVYPASGSTTATLVQGSTYTLTVKGGTYTNSYISAWIDYNNDGVFNSTNEFIGASGNVGNSTNGNITTSWTIPGTSVTGPVTLRLRETDTSPGPSSTQSCGAANSGFGEAEDYTITIQAGTPLAYSSVTTTQSVTTAVSKSSTSQQIIGVEIVMTGNTGTINATSFSFATTGSSAATTDITNAKLWYTGTSSTFATTAQVGSTVVGPNGTFTFAPTQALSGGTNYFWLTYDIKSTATVNDVVDAVCTSVTIDGTPRTPTVTDPTGSRSIVNSYCAAAAAGETNSGFNITNVTFNGVSNNTGAETSCYGDYTSISNVVLAGNTYTLSATVNYSTFQLTAYFDWNNNGVFTDGGESYVLSTNTTSGTAYTASIAIPASSSGTVRMRVVFSNTTPVSCANPTWGEAEDYNLTLCGVTAGSLTCPAPTVCQGGTATISIAGQGGGTTLQWQSSADNSTWANISGATTGTYTTPALATTSYYRVQVTNSCPVYTPSQTITVIPTVSGGTIYGPSLICTGTVASMSVVGYSGTLQWQSSPNNSTWTNISGATSDTYVSGAISSTTYFRVVATATAPCTGTANSAAFTVNVSTSAGIWKGTSSVAWMTAANWCGNAVPATTTDVYIPGGTTYAPTVASGDAANCRDLNIYSGATLTVSSSGSGHLSIYGNIVNDGTIDHTTGSGISGGGLLGSSTSWIYLKGSNNTIGGIGSFSNNALDIYNSANYTLVHDVSLSGIRAEASPDGVLNFSSYTLTASLANQQYGTYNLNTGVFWDKMFGQTFTVGSFNNNSGTWVWDITGKASNGSFNIQDNDWYNVRLICDPGYTITLSGISNLYLAGSFTIDPNTTFADGNIPMSVGKNWVNNGTYISNSTGGGGTTGPLLTFNGSAAQYIIGNSNSFYDVTINNSAGVYMQQDNTIGNVFTLTSGLWNTGAYKIIVSNTSTSAITGHSTSSYINTGSLGALRRYIASTGSYDLPVGNSNAYELMNLNFTSGNTITYIDVNFDNPSNATGTGLPITEATYTYQSVLNNGGVNATTGNSYGGVWTVTPNSGTATYNTSLYGRNYSNAGTTRNTVLKRTTAGPGAWGLYGTYSSSTTTNPITAVRTGLSGFSQFAIGSTSAPLPVSILSFNAIKDGNVNQVTWISGAPSKQLYTIEKSVDGVNFEVLDTRESESDNLRTHAYTITDRNPSKVTYYRLKIIGSEGKIQYTSIVSVSQVKEKLYNTLVYIDKQNSSIKVSFESDITSDVELKVFDVVGRAIGTLSGRAIEGNNEFEIGIKENLNGIYFVILKDGDQVITRKISAK